MKLSDKILEDMKKREVEFVDFSQYEYVTRMITNHCRSLIYSEYPRWRKFKGIEDLGCNARFSDNPAKDGWESGLLGSVMVGEMTYSDTHGNYWKNCEIEEYL